MGRDVNVSSIGGARIGLWLVVGVFIALAVCGNNKAHKNGDRIMDKASQNIADIRIGR